MKKKKLNALSSIVTWVGDPSHLNKSSTGLEEVSDDLNDFSDENSDGDPDTHSDGESDRDTNDERSPGISAESDEDTLEEASSDADSHTSLENNPRENLALESLNSLEESLEALEDSMGSRDTSRDTSRGTPRDTKESDDTLSEIPDDLPDDLNSQLDRISKLLHAEAERSEKEDLLHPGAPFSGTAFDPERELALQIAEDMALEQSMALANQELLESSLHPFNSHGEAFSTDETPGTTLDETPGAIPSATPGPNTGTKAGATADAPPLELAEIQSCIEALLFISDKPLSTVKLKELLGPELDRELFQDAVTGLCQKYQQVAHGIEVVEVAGGLQFRTKPGRASLAQKLAKVQSQRLSSGGMESLAIIAYRQPVMKEDIDKVRGVDSSYFIRGLMEKKLIKISGRSELPGRPSLYNTTPEFLELFGLRDLASLPSLRELEQMIPSSQSTNPEDEDPRIRTMRRLVGEMNVDGLGALKYDPKEDEKLLKEFRERITAIPSSTPYLDEMKAAEILAKQQLALQEQEQAAVLGQHHGRIQQPVIEE